MKLFEYAAQNQRWVNPVVFGVESGVGRFKASWQALRTAVERYVAIAIGKQRTFSSMTPSMQSRFEAFFPQANRCFDSRMSGDRLYMYKALVWRSVWEHQLSPQCADKWHGREWAAFGELRDILRSDNNTSFPGSTNQPFIFISI